MLSCMVIFRKIIIFCVSEFKFSVCALMALNMRVSKF